MRTEIIVTCMLLTAGLGLLAADSATARPLPCVVAGDVTEGDLLVGCKVSDGVWFCTAYDNYQPRQCRY